MIALQHNSEAFFSFSYACPPSPSSPLPPPPPPPPSSGAVWKSRRPSWAPVPDKPMVSVDVKQHLSNNIPRANAWWHTKGERVVTHQGRTRGDTPRANAWWHAKAERVLTHQCWTCSDTPRADAWWHTKAEPVVTHLDWTRGDTPRLNAWWHTKTERVVTHHGRKRGDTPWPKAWWHTKAERVERWEEGGARGHRNWERTLLGCCALPTSQDRVSNSHHHHPTRPPTPAQVPSYPVFDRVVMALRRDCVGLPCTSRQWWAEASSLKQWWAEASSLKQWWAEASSLKQWWAEASSLNKRRTLMCLDHFA